MPNAWDIGSAKLLEASGFKAIGTTSAGIAFSLGHPDNCFCSRGARLDRDVMMDRIESIVKCLSVPVNADLEGGFGDSPEAVYDTIKLAIKAGAAGGNIEDYKGEISEPLYDLNLSVERIQAARKAIDESGIPFVLIGRTDSMNIGAANSFNEAVKRANLYRNAGADCIFAPGINDSSSIAQLIKEVNAPVNVVMGLTGSKLTVAELKDLGVRRISIGGSLARSVYSQIRKAAIEMIEKGTFTFANEQILLGELNKIFENK